MSSAITLSAGASTSSACVCSGGYYKKAGSLSASTDYNKTIIYYGVRGSTNYPAAPSQGEVAIFNVSSQTCGTNIPQTVGSVFTYNNAFTCWDMTADKSVLYASKQGDSLVSYNFTSGVIIRIAFSNIMGVYVGKITSNIYLSFYVISSTIKVKTPSGSWSDMQSVSAPFPYKTYNMIMTFNESIAYVVVETDTQTDLLYKCYLNSTSQITPYNIHLAGADLGWSNYVENTVTDAVGTTVNLGLQILSLILDPTEQYLSYES
jgi:hypothetical protein